MRTLCPGYTSRARECECASAITSEYAVACPSYVEMGRGLGLFLLLCEDVSLGVWFATRWCCARLNEIQCCEWRQGRPNPVGAEQVMAWSVAVAGKSGTDWRSLFDRVSPRKRRCWRDVELVVGERLFAVLRTVFSAQCFLVALTNG